MSQSRNEDKNSTKDNLGRSHAELSRMMQQGRSFSGLERHCAFLNTGSFPAAANRFAIVSAAAGIDFPDDGRAFVPVDWDHDGDLDLWITARNAPRIRFLKNNSQSGNHFVGIKLTGNGIESSRDAIGARVEVITLPRDSKIKTMQSLRAGEGFLSQESKWLHFGLQQRQKIEAVIVHWPGGERERFTGIEADNRYTLSQGNSIAIRLPAREQLNLAAAEPIIPAPSQQARIPLLTRLPKTTIDYLDFAGKKQQLATGLGKPTLVTLWASWCPSCMHELREFTEREQEIKTGNIDILALSVDGLGDDRSDPEQAKKVLQDMSFPFASGIATPQLVSELQELHDLLITLKHPLPVPTSFLIDANGRISVIYKGQAHVDDILKDVKTGKLTPAQRLGYAAPIKGRTINDPLLDKVFLENQARALFFFGTKLLDRKQADAAILFFRDVLSLKPKSYKAHYNLGLAYRSRNNPEAALYHFKKALDSNPDFIETHQLLAGILLTRGQLDKAKEHYLKYLTVYPDNPITLTSLGVIAANQGEMGKAEQRFSEAIAVAPALLEPRYNLGALFLAQGKRDDAEQLFLSLLQARPGYPDIHYNLGVLYEQRKDFAKATDYYLRELKIRPGSAKTLTAMGRLMEQNGNYPQANNYFSRAISFRPDFAPALEGQARLRINR